MVLTQPVAQLGLDRAEVDLLVLEQRPDPARPHGGLSEQPAVAFVFVDAEYLFGDPIDVPGAELHHEACRGHDKRYLPALPRQLIKTPLQESLVADPVGADQRAGGHATLGQPPRVLAVHSARPDSAIQDRSKTVFPLPGRGRQLHHAPRLGQPPEKPDVARSWATVHVASVEHWLASVL